MAETYTLLSKTTISSTSSSITFTNIPQNYTDLVLHISARSDVSSSLAGNFLILFNGTTSGSSGYVGRRLYADPSGGSTAVAGDGTNKWSGFVIGNSSEVINNNKLKIYNYSGSQIKTWDVQTVVENNGNSGYVGFGSQRWENTAAISSFVLSNITSGANAGNFLPKSTFYLYGIAAEGVTPLNTSAPYADGGDSIYTDGTYWIHVFNSSGAFTPRKNLTCDYLVVAGGGGGAGSDTSSEANGGGGAGGFRTSADNFLTDTSYTITVGAGGVGGNYVNPGGSTNGTSTSISGSGFTTFTASGGGYGSWLFGNSGGSGGGGGRGRDGGSGNSGGYSPVEGYAGGNAPFSSGGGGGGGASSAGANGASTVGGAGGAGVSSSISGSSVTYAGGGGGAGTVTGGSGGSGGGGAGANSSVGNGTSGTSNTGGGGGGGRQHNGGNGGSGIVIVRYLK